MEPDKFPKGDVYLIGSDVNDPIVILSGTESFSIRVSVKNCSTVTWDTSEQLRLAVWLMDISPQYSDKPLHVSERRLDFPQQFVHPQIETSFDVSINVNLIPEGNYLLQFDLVVEQRYFLASSGGQRYSRRLDIVDTVAPGLVLYDDVKAPSAPLRRTWLANLTVGSPTSAFQLIDNSDVCLRNNNGIINNKKVIVKFDWWPFFFRHYAHFLEFIICLYAICKEHIGEADEIIIVIGDQEFTTGNNPDVQRFFLNSLFKKWKVLPHLNDADSKDAAFIIEFDGRRQKTPINRIIVDHLDLVLSSLASFKSRCLGQITYLAQRPDRKTAVYAKRGGSRSISAHAESQMISIFHEFGYEILHVDFGKLSISEQINIASNANVMFGVHGNNLTNCVWLSKGAALVEIFPAGFHGTDFQVLCEICGASYLGAEARELGFVHRELSRLPDWTVLKEPYNTSQHHQDNVDYIPEKVLRSFLRTIS